MKGVEDSLVAVSVAAVVIVNRRSGVFEIAATIVSAAASVMITSSITIAIIIKRRDSTIACTLGLQG